jgi:hypothetical protein
LASSTGLSQLEYNDFYGLLDGQTLVKFNNKGINDPKVRLYQELNERIADLGTPPYYYSSVVKSYLHRFDSITEDNLKLRYDSLN